ncbi:MAG TPA: hypothetical protein VLF67_03310 [Candidatus Saccharimonas sp.]|nr:hypothetical protein [Candidatus Saccharimonas sp.]
MKHARLAASLIIGLAATIGLLTLLLPPHPSASFTELGLRLSLILTTAVMVLQIGASALFIWSLGGFKQQLRIAYLFISIGIILFGVAYFQTPILIYLDQTASFWVTAGVVSIPFIAPVLLYYIGVRRFASLFGYKSLWTSTWFAAALSIGATAVVVACAQVLQPSIGGSISSVGFSVWVSVIFGLVAIILLNIRGRASEIYRQPLGWFATALFIETFSGLLYTTLVLTGTYDLVAPSGALDLPHVLGSLAFLMSGYYFKLINESTVPVGTSSVLLIDIVVFAASQASNPSQINTLLDTLRAITASQAQQGLLHLTPQEEAALRKVYLGIEQYLINQEPLRQFTLQQIRDRVKSNFKLSDEAFEAAINPSPVANAQPQPA